MIPFALAFVFGAWGLQQMAALPDLHWAFSLLAFLPGFCLLLKACAIDSAWAKLASLFTLILLGVLAGFFWSAVMAQHRLSQFLPGEWEGQDIQVVGVIASMPQAMERDQRFEFDVERVLTPGATVPPHIALSDYRSGFGQRGDERAKPPSLALHAGERWRLSVRLKRPHGTANPHGFDFEAWALEHTIRASGYVRQHGENSRLQARVWQLSYIVEMARERIRTRMQAVLGDRPYAGILQALAIGDDSAIDQRDWQVFLRTGTNHLVSISGLHITMLSGMAYALLYAGWRRSERLTLHLPARKAAVIAGAVAALLYALIAGFSVPTQRTLYMLSVFACALWSGRAIAMLRVLAYALLLVVVLDPWAVMAPGFWLSFGAVALISYAVAGRLKAPSWWRAAIHTQWAVTLGLVPILLLLFQQVSLLSPLANAIAIPVISLLVVPLTLLGSLLPVDSALLLAHGEMSLCMDLLRWLATFPLSVWQQQAPPWWTLPLAMAGALVLLLPRGLPMRWLGALAFLPMLLVSPPRPLVGGMQVTVLDVGQGLAVVVKTSGHSLLYDTGPRYSSQSDSGSRVVVPYLRGEGIRQLDGMVVSHNDSDHSGGMASVLAAVKIGWLASSLPAEVLAGALTDAGSKSGAVSGDTISPTAAMWMPASPPMQCYAGQHWRWDQVQFEMLYPTLEQYVDGSIKDNNRSCVLKITSAAGSLLLAGDIEKQAEAQLLQASAGKLSADVLVAPHHGSRTSSTAAFIAAVLPQATVFTVGYRNRFHHPHPGVVQRYQVQGARLYRSDRDGAIVLDFPGNSATRSARSKKESRLGNADHETIGIRITRWRQQHLRYWQDTTMTE